MLRRYCPWEQGGRILTALGKIPVNPNRSCLLQYMALLWAVIVEVLISSICTLFWVTSNQRTAEVISLFILHYCRITGNVMVGDGCSRLLWGGGFLPVSSQWASRFPFLLYFCAACVSICSVATEAADTAAAGQALGWQPHAAVSCWLCAKKAEVRAAWCSCSALEKQGIVCSAAGCACTASLIAQPHCFGHSLLVLSLSCKQVKTMRGKFTNFGGYNLEVCKLHLSTISWYWDWWFNFWVC